MSDQSMTPVSGHSGRSPVARHRPVAQRTRLRSAVRWLLLAALCLLPAGFAARWWDQQSEKRFQSRLQALATASVEAAAAKGAGVAEDRSTAELSQLARERDWDPQVFYWLGVRLTAQGDHKEAVKALARSAALNPGSASTRAALGTAMARADQPEEGIVQLNQAISLNPNLEFAHFSLGNIYGQYHQWDQAEAHLKRAVALNPDDLEATYLLAQCYEHLFMEDRKMALLEGLVKRSPNDARFLKSLGYVYLFFGKFADGEALYRRILEMAPDDQEARYLLGRALAEQASAPEGFAQAEKELAYVAAAAENQPGVHVALGILYFRQSRWKEAAQQFERALDAGSTETKTLLYLGQSYLRMGKTAEGRKRLAKFERHSRISRTTSQQENRIYSLPEQTTEQLHEKDRIRVALAEVYIEDNNFAAALRHLLLVEKNEPESAAAKRLIADCKAKAGIKNSP